MAWFRRGHPVDPQELERVKQEIRSLRDAITAADERRLQPDATTAAPDPLVPDDHAGAGADPELAAARLDELATRLDELAQRPASSDPRLDELVSKLSELDQRVTAVSTELANQVSELGNDIDALAGRPPGEAPGEELIEELRDGQVRLANEQARYQIAFREDLARLAEQLRRPG